MSCRPLSGSNEAPGMPHRTCGPLIHRPGAEHSSGQQHDQFRRVMIGGVTGRGRWFVLRRQQKSGLHELLPLNTYPVTDIVLAAGFAVGVDDVPICWTARQRGRRRFDGGNGCTANCLRCQAGRPSETVMVVAATLSTVTLRRTTGCRRRRRLFTRLHSRGSTTPPNSTGALSDVQNRAAGGEVSSVGRHSRCQPGADRKANSDECGCGAGPWVSFSTWLLWMSSRVDGRMVGQVANGQGGNR